MACSRRSAISPSSTPPQGALPPQGRTLDLDLLWQCNQDKSGWLNILYHDTDEAFTAASSGPAPGGGRGGGPREAKADPVGYMDDVNRALRNKLLAVPEERARYLQYIHHIATNALGWAKIGPTVDTYRVLIRADVEVDTRKLYRLLTARKTSSATSSRSVEPIYAPIQRSLKREAGHLSFET